jgi:hypothetical protein
MRNRQVAGVVRNHASESYDNDNNGREYPTNSVDFALGVTRLVQVCHRDLPRRHHPKAAFPLN